MTLTKEEKLRLMRGKDNWQSDDLDGKLPSFRCADGPIGLREMEKMDTFECKTIPGFAYPSGQVLAQTWNQELSEEMGKALANDCIERGIDIILGPACCLDRYPLCGRNFEYMSEDPVLSGTMAYSYIIGVQNEHVGTSLKHYVLNSMEYSRVYSSSEIDERVLREMYVRNFALAAKANPWTVMCSYNLVNGVRMAENKKMFDMLREESGFDGIYISDWGATKDAMKSMEAGLSISMPYEKEIDDQRKKALEEGNINEEELDKRANEVINFVYKVESERKLRKITMTREDRRKAALKIAEEGIILCKNEDALPIVPREKVLVSGPFSEFVPQGGGSSKVLIGNPPSFVLNQTGEDNDLPFTKEKTLAQHLKDRNVDVSTYTLMRYLNGSMVQVDNLRGAIPTLLKTDTVVLCIGDDEKSETEDVDRESMNLSSDMLEVVLEVRKYCKNLVLVVFAGGPIDLSAVEPAADAILYCGYPGQIGFEAIAKVLTGEVNPSGRFAQTYCYHLEDYPTYPLVRDISTVRYVEGFDVGYRYFVNADIPVLYPFGYGLSYSEFVYEELRTKKTGDYDFDVEVDVENISEFDGKEVVQLYVRDVTRVVYRPERELKAYVKVELKAGERKTVKFHLDRETFMYYSTGFDKWTVNDGIFEIQIGKNSEDIVLTKLIEVGK